MSRFQQNLMYAVILLIVFGLSVYFFTFKKDYETKGVFLPKYSAELPAVDPSKVRVFNLQYQSDTKGNIGQVRTSTHVAEEKDFQKLCDRNLQEAVKLAAEHGAHEIKYVCLYPEGQINELSSVQLRAYAFRD
ncbi:membrane protein [Candidatus Francisella endociliophora]|uniref:Membrane protein n=1 Tax=Candidatus Francisella endociliophora TaxID=653937 RepID=A0A097EMG1_9GAMM|nr:hypothetical protein [Francisella sp. FSC1006]AIT08750.1 membrane protein [Francisella sp. FSC1006]